jgi:hypothetical protein
MSEFMTRVASANNLSGLDLKKEWLYGAAIVLGSFLLFQVELISSKYILPWFGGAPAVWTTSMLVFQVVLLAGYGYAHFLTTRLSTRAQVRTHVCLIGFSLLVLAVLAFRWVSPIIPNANWKPSDVTHPVWDIVSLLLVSVGLPFFLLSATNPLLQGWFARTYGRSPYRLYAVSNVASLLGLLTYPLLLEPNLTVRSQSWLWSAGYLAYAAIGAICTQSMDRGPGVVEQESPATVKRRRSEQKTTGTHLLWFFLAACASIMFLATTNMLCQEITVMPFLWVLPLSLYLITLILCFDAAHWYSRAVFHPLLPLSLALILLTPSIKLVHQIGSYSFALFIVCMICHGELVRSKPSSRYLTSFYLMIAAGGAAGGVFVALIAPLLFTGFWEFQIAVCGCGLLLFLALYRDRGSWFYQGSAWIPLCIVLGLGAILEYTLRTFPSTNGVRALETYLHMALVATGLIAAGFGLASIKSRVQLRWVQAYAGVVLVSITIVCVALPYSQMRSAVARYRSFFGVFRIEKQGTRLNLLHGQTRHGVQIQDGVHDVTPLSYYGNNSGIGILLLNHPRRLSSGPDSDLRVGVVGLGTGTLAAYGRPGDYYHFYEIDPEVERISYGPEARFTFLKNAPANVEVTLGDARLSMEREAAQGEFQKFDVLALDAFDSDSIPVHLMSREAMQLYLTHLRNQNSVIAFHISNRTLDLSPVVRGLSRQFNLALLVVTSLESGPEIEASRWALLSRNADALRLPELRRRAEVPSPAARSVLWTDDYSNVLGLVSRKSWW